MRWGTDLSLDKSTVGEEGTGSELVFLPVNTLTPGVRICAGEKFLALPKAETTDSDGTESAEVSDVLQDL